MRRKGYSYKEHQCSLPACVKVLRQENACELNKFEDLLPGQEPEFLNAERLQSGFEFS